MNETNAIAKKKEQNCSTLAPGMIAPLFILAPPRSFTSIISTMLGQHPQMYGLPELELFGAETLAKWWDLCARATFPRAHGALRVIAQLYFGEQTETTVKLARGWLRRRSHFTTGFFLELLAKKVHPRIRVEKSTSTVYSFQALQRAYRMFPQARFLHLVRHPRGHGESVMKFLRERKDECTPKIPLDAASGGLSCPGLAEGEQRAGGTRPRSATGLVCVAPEYLGVSSRDSPRAAAADSGEDVLPAPEQYLQELATWLGVRTDAEAIEAMKHPEQSPYACFGPPGARYGNDRFFGEDPVLRPGRAQRQSLGGLLRWRKDGQGFLPQVKALAQEFDYE
jgi:hypothetical protein